MHSGCLGGGALLCRSCAQERRRGAHALARTGGSCICEVGARSRLVHGRGSKLPMAVVCIGMRFSTSSSQACGLMPCHSQVPSSE